MAIFSPFKSKAEEPIKKEQALRIAESEIIEKGLKIHNVDIKEPAEEEWKGEKCWVINYISKKGETDEVVVSEFGKIVENNISKDEAMKLAKEEFKKKGVDLARVKLDEKSKKLNGREYWIVKYTTSYGFSDKVLISKKRGIISY